MYLYIIKKNKNGAKYSSKKNSKKRYFVVDFIRICSAIEIVNFGYSSELKKQILYSLMSIKMVVGLFHLLLFFFVFLE